MNIILTSEMRVGSRWLHYLLADLLNKDVSGELDVSRIPECQSFVEKQFKQNKIVKFHHAKVYEILLLEGNYKIIGIVRNPRDRIVSWAFHQRFKPEGIGLKEIKKAPNDKEAIRVALNHPVTQQHDKDQLALMIRDLSTKRYKSDYNQRYIWTSYHWLKENLVEEITTIAKFLGEKVSAFEIRNVCKKHEFKARSGRETGDEERENEWFRKGVEYDFMSWFDLEMVQDTTNISAKYWKILYNEEGKKISDKELSI